MAGTTSPALAHWCLLFFGVDMPVVKGPGLKRFVPVPSR